MKKQTVIKALVTAGLGVFMMAANANAAVIFETDLGTGFNSTTNLFINSSFGAAATLTFTPNGPTSSGVPSNVNYGTFSLSCSACSPQSLGAGAALTRAARSLRHGNYRSADLSCYALLGFALDCFATTRT